MITIPLCARTDEYCKLVEQLYDVFIEPDLQRMLDKQVEEDKETGLYYQKYNGNADYESLIEKMRKRKILINLTGAKRVNTND